MTERSPEPSHLLEAVLFASPRPVTIRALRSATGFSENEARAALEALKTRYSSGSSGIVLREVAGGYQLATDPTCAGAVERFRDEARPTPLSGAAHEVLACVLYLGPLTRSAVSSARGVNSDAIVRNLLERDLLAESGRDASLPGAPALLDVTEDFLVAAGANGRDDFPLLDSLMDQRELDRVRERLTGAGTEAPREGGS